MSHSISRVNISALLVAAADVSKIQLPLPDHNAVLPADTLTSVSLNFKWRRIVVHLAETLLDRRIFDGSETEIDAAIQQVQALLSDMYTFEEIGMPYLGAFVARTTDIVATPTGLIASLENDFSFPLHDVGDFFDLAADDRLIVPVGGAGFYHCFASGQWKSGVATAVLRLFRGVTTQLAIGSSPDTTQHQVACQSVAFFQDGETLRVEVRNTGGNRVLGADSFTPWSISLAMYRVGNAP